MIFELFYYYCETPHLKLHLNCQVCSVMRQQVIILSHKYSLPFTTWEHLGINGIPILSKMLLQASPVSSSSVLVFFSPSLWSCWPFLLTDAQGCPFSNETRNEVTWRSSYQMPVTRLLRPVSSDEPSENSSGE